MKTIKLLFIALVTVAVTTSCTREVYVDDDQEPGIALNQLLNTYEIWYVDIHDSYPSNNIPFMNIAFTFSYRNGVLYANNNLAGIGSTGNGFGIDVGYYNTSGVNLQVDHDLDGVWNFEVTQLSSNRVELYNAYTGASYILEGYQRSNFNYDYVFYDNIHYFLQEYEAWEKTYVSQEGALNEFDNENFLAFLPDGNGDTFLSSIDSPGTSISQLYWDYEGIYEVLDVSGDDYVKVLTLDYDYLDNEYFELYVINDQTVELYHPSSGTTYRFEGRGYIQYMRNTDAAKGDNTTTARKQRVKRTNRVFDKNMFKK